MVLQIGDWKFDIDLTQTMQYSSAEALEHCDCAYCRNFYTVVDEYYPNLRSFFAEFGLNIEAPDELMPYDYEGKMYYEGMYMVCGRIMEVGKRPIICEGLCIQPNDTVSIPHDCPQPCFALEVSTIILPWVLNEPMEDTISPANLPSFIQKMWDRLLGKSKKSNIQS